MEFSPTIQCHCRTQKTLSQNFFYKKKHSALSRRVLENAPRKQSCEEDSSNTSLAWPTNFLRNHSLYFPNVFLPTQINIRFRIYLPGPKTNAERVMLPTNIRATNKQFHSIHSNGIYECELREMRRVKHISSHRANWPSTHGLDDCRDNNTIAAQNAFRLIFSPF